MSSRPLGWLLSLIVACSRAPATPPSSASAATTTPTAIAKDAAAKDAAARDAPPSADRGDAGKPPTIGAMEATDLLFGAAKETPPLCANAEEAIRCLLGARYAGDEAARRIALDLYARTGDVAGVERTHVMNGGYRGMLHIVPSVPTGGNRAHLARVASALIDYDAFFSALTSEGRPAVAYRWRALSLRFFESVRARTPSAYASDWTVAYNVSGSLNGTDDSVRETMFHEIFHLNDAAHGAGGAGAWSSAALGSIYDSIVARCRADTACLAPLAPNGTMVRGGTYYAFQPGNDVREYAAELALRYYREERGALGQGPRVAPFKCGRTENARAWRAVVAEFFGGIDLVPECARPSVP